MRSRYLALFGSIGLVAIVFLAYSSFFANVPTHSSSSTSPPNASIPTSTNNLGTATTLEDLIAGKFPTASDKQGTGGVTVTVQNLQVLYVRTETDGDWHVGVTDGRVVVFITEITPSYQASEGMPPVGSSIDETGIAYCDTAHQTESWHGNTCWEIHPVTGWQLSSAGVSQSSAQKSAIAADYNMSISYDQDPIPRGSTQSITMLVQDSDGPVRNSVVSIEVDYASGSTVHNFSCTTSSDGTCSISWEIGPTATPGTFRVIVEVGGQDFDSSFYVTD